MPYVRRVMLNQRTDWCFKTEPEAGLNGRVINYPRGRVIGVISIRDILKYLARHLEVVEY